MATAQGEAKVLNWPPFAALRSGICRGDTGGTDPQAISIRYISESGLQSAKAEIQVINRCGSTKSERYSRIKWDFRLGIRKQRVTKRLTYSGNEKSRWRREKR